MKLTIIVILSAAVTINLNPLPTLAAHPLCQQATAKAKIQLGSVKSVNLSRLSSVYGRHPTGRPIAISFVFKSDQPMGKIDLQMTISKTLMAKCPAVSLVSFSVDETDWVYFYGLVKGQVRRFACKEAGTTIQWGEQYCL